MAFIKVLVNILTFLQIYMPLLSVLFWALIYLRVFRTTIGLESRSIMMVTTTVSCTWARQPKACPNTCVGQVWNDLWTKPRTTVGPIAKWDNRKVARRAHHIQDDQVWQFVKVPSLRLTFRSKSYRSLGVQLETGPTPTQLTRPDQSPNNWVRFGSGRKSRLE